MQYAWLAARCSRVIAVGRPGVFFDVRDWRVDSLLIEMTSCNESLKTMCHDVVIFFFPPDRGQMNCQRGSGTYAYGRQMRSWGKVAKPVSTAPPPKGWGKIKEVFKAFAVRGVVPKWTAYRKAQVIKTYKPWMELYMLRTIRKVPLQKSWIKYVIGKDWSLPTQAWLLLSDLSPIHLPPNNIPRRFGEPREPRGRCSSSVCTFQPRPGFFFLTFLVSPFFLLTGGETGYTPFTPPGSPPAGAAPVTPGLLRAKPGPGLRDLIQKIEALQPGVPVQGFGLKARHQAARTYGRHLKRSLVVKLLALETARAISTNFRLRQRQSNIFWGLGSW